MANGGGVTPLWDNGDVAETGQRAKWWSVRRPSVRVVVSDADPAMCGTIAHLLGVAFRTPVIAQSMNARLRVEVLGDYRVDTSLMATAMGEPFAAEPVTRFVAGDDIVAVATLTGLSTVAHERAFVEESGAPIVSLARLDGLIVPSGAPLSLADVSCTAADAVAVRSSPDMSVAEIADRCFAFTTIVANELAG